MAKKIFNLVTSFKSMEEGDGLRIKGLASTSDVDRAGDVIAQEAWLKGGLDNFNSNPVILFNHNSNEPIGKAEEITSTVKGLELTAWISKAAGKTYELIKDGVLGAFSVSFLIKDADFIEETYGLLIKDAELMEVSVVSIPCNQAATFSLAKSFDSDEEYQDYKKTFTHSVAGQLPTDKEDNSSSIDRHTPAGAHSAHMEIEMTPEELQALTEKVAKEAAAAATKAFKIQQDLKDAEAKAKSIADASAAEKTALTVAKTGAEKLAEDLTAELTKKDADMAQVILKFQADLDEKAKELDDMRTSRGQFNRRGNESTEDWIAKSGTELLAAHMLGQMTGKGWNTKYANELLEKAGIEYEAAAPRLDEELQNQMQKEITVHTKVAQLFREIPVNGQSTVMPLQGDTNMATWQAGATQDGNGVFTSNLVNNPSSVGTAGDYDVQQVVMLVERLISSSYINNNTDEQILINLMPMLVDGVARAHARAVESALLIETGPFSSLSVHATVASQTAPAIGAVDAGLLMLMRADMGKYGLNPADLVYVVNQDVYYTLLADAAFENLNEVGPIATKLTGQVGQIYGIPVLVSDEFVTPATVTVAAFLVHKASYVIPRLKGMTVEQDYEVGKQRRIIVATQQLGFTELFAAATASIVLKYAV